MGGVRCGSVEVSAWRQESPCSTFRQLVSKPKPLRCAPRRSQQQTTHPVAADAKVAVAQLGRLLRRQHRVLGAAVVDLLGRGRIRCDGRQATNVGNINIMDPMHWQNSVGSAAAVKTGVH